VYHKIQNFVIDMKKSSLIVAFSLAISILFGQIEADQLYQNNEFAKAMPLFKQLSADNPGNYAHFEKYVLCLMQLQEMDQAETAMKERLKTDSTNPELYFLYGSFLSRQGRSSEADSIRQQRRKLLDEGYGAKQWAAAPPASSPSPPVKRDEIEPIKAEEADEMPLWLHPDCEQVTDVKERKFCSDKKMLEHIYKNVLYPVEARENGAQGTAVITFVIEKDGSMTSLRIFRDPGYGIGEAALSAVQRMQSSGIAWKPGKQKGMPVRVQFNMPVRFKLTEGGQK
ncbi:MAG TPA: TonB family protein, partial [Saprospiraceae bacterium]|nr:TonB family protein [Saprospiraceae bacterium]